MASRRSAGVSAATVAALALIAAVIAAAPTPAQAQEMAPLTGRTREGPRKLGRSGWATLLVGYGALSAAAVGAAHIFRDNFIGRSISTTAGGWGGMTIGAVAGEAAVALGRSSTGASRGCPDDQEAAAVIGGALGAAAGGFAAYFLTRQEGPSRTYTTAGGMAPAFLFLVTGTLLDW